MRPNHRNLFILGLALMALGFTACSGNRAVSSSCCAPDPCVPCATDPCTPACAPCADRPPQAECGETWCKVYDPPVYKTLVQKVCVCPCKIKKVYIPPEYGTRMKVVCVQPAKLKEVTRPGLWDTREREVVDCPSQERWRRICCESGGEPCEVRGDCWVKECTPPTYRKECERVCLAPPQTCVEFTPAQYKCVDERILVKEGFVEEYRTPAKYETRTREVCVRPGCWRWERRPDCDIPAGSLPALEVTMKDASPEGGNDGVFKVGQVVRYDLNVRSDEGSKSMTDLKVVFDLPAELELVQVEGIGASTAGRTVTTSAFPLGVGESKDVRVLAKVVGVPPSTLVQFGASVQMSDGTVLASESESTTLTAGD